MHPLLNRLCRKAPPPLPSSLAMPPAGVSGPAAAATGSVEAAAPAVVPAETAACGWFDSSLDLRQGLAVSEVRDTDWTVLVLWFGPAALRGSARLQ